MKIIITHYQEAATVQLLKHDTPTSSLLAFGGTTVARVCGGGGGEDGGGGINRLSFYESMF